MSNKEIWYESLYNHFGQYFSMDNILYKEQTNHQDLIIFENAAMGRIMVLDGVVQTTERDEFIYHEMMAHVPLITHNNAKKVLIIGGGDGGVLREVSYHLNIDYITMVEIDAKVITVCQQYLPNHSAGNFKNPRFTIIIDNGANFVNQCSEVFDVIISDCTDPIGPGKSLFTSNFYQDCARCLNDDGIFITQNGVCFLQQEEVINSYRRLDNHFRYVGAYQAAIPTYYGGNMTFVWASHNRPLHSLNEALLNARIAKARLNCRYYNAAIHNGSFALPQYLLNALSAIS